MGNVLRRRRHHDVLAIAPAERFIQVGIVRFSAKTYGLHKPVEYTHTALMKMHNVTSPYTSPITSRVKSSVALVGSGGQAFVLKCHSHTAQFLTRLHAYLASTLYSSLIGMVVVSAFALIALGVVLYLLYVKKERSRSIELSSMNLNIPPPPLTPLDTTPLRRQGEEEKEEGGSSDGPVVITAALRSAFKLVTESHTWIKHGRYHTRQIRLVSVSEDLTLLTWRGVGESRAKGKPLSSFARVEIGSQDHLMRCAHGCLVSFIGKSSKERTLHFEYTANARTDDNYRGASDWVDALTLCLASAEKLQTYHAEHPDDNELLSKSPSAKLVVDLHNSPGSPSSPSPNTRRQLFR